jgi:hypothetical protein
VKVTFEGPYFADILDQMRSCLTHINVAMGGAPGPIPDLEEPPAPPAPPAKKAKAAPPKPKGRKPGRPPKDAVKAVEKAVEKALGKAVEKVEEEIAEAFEELELTPQAEPEVLDAQKLAAIQVETTKDLRAAYASGKHNQVLALLSKFGNGAKSFRELQIQDFPPIRKAIDDGALK